MKWSPSFECHVRPDGEHVYRIGHQLIDEFLEFVVGRARPNTVRAYAHDLSVFFSVVKKDPLEVRPKDVMAFVTAQRRPKPGAENVVRIADGSAGLSAATIKRRLAAVSSFYGYLITRDDVEVTANPVPRGIATRQSRSRGGRGLPLVRGVRRLPRILDPDEIDALMGALRTERDRAMTQAMVLGGLRRCEVLGLRLGDLRLGEWRVLIREGKGGHERLVPLSPTFFATVARYMDHERPETTSDALFVALKGARRGQPLSMPGLAPDHPRRPAARRTQPRHLPRAAPHLLHPPARGGHGHRSHPGPGRTPLHHLDAGLSAPRHGLAGRRVPPGHQKPSRPRRSWGWPNERTRTQQPAPEPRRRAAGRPRSRGAEIAARAPVMVATMASYLDQLEVSARPGTVAAAELTLRFFAHRVTEADPSCVSVARIGRPHIEDFKSLAGRPSGQDRQALGHHDHPAPAQHGAHLLRAHHGVGLRRRPGPSVHLHERLPGPRRAAAQVLGRPDGGQVHGRTGAGPQPAPSSHGRAVGPHRHARRRARRTRRRRHGPQGRRSIGSASPIGKLHNDRYVPLLPMLVDLIVEYQAVRGRSRSGHLLERDDGRPFDRRTIHRYVASVAKRAGIGHVHPHQLRHTLATQSINRGMSLEAIAALLGHRSMDMTLIYARISDDTVADAYFKVTEAVEAQYYGLSGAVPCAVELPARASRRPTTIVDCSPTVTARGPLCSTAPSRASVSAAGSSRPVRSSSPS